MPAAGWFVFVVVASVALASQDNTLFLNATTDFPHNFTTVQGPAFLFVVLKEGEACVQDMNLYITGSVSEKVADFRPQMTWLNTVLPLHVFPLLATEEHTLLVMIASVCNRTEAPHEAPIGSSEESRLRDEEVFDESGNATNATTTTIEPEATTTSEEESDVSTSPGTNETATATTPAPTTTTTTATTTTTTTVAPTTTSATTTTTATTSTTVPTSATTGATTTVASTTTSATTSVAPATTTSTTTSETTTTVSSSVSQTSSSVEGPTLGPDTRNSTLLYRAVPIASYGSRVTCPGACALRRNTTEGGYEVVAVVSSSDPFQMTWSDDPDAPCWNCTVSGWSSSPLEIEIPPGVKGSALFLTDFGLLARRASVSRHDKTLRLFQSEGASFGRLSYNIVKRDGGTLFFVALRTADLNAKLFAGPAIPVRGSVGQEREVDSALHAASVFILADSPPSEFVVSVETEKPDEMEYLVGGWSDYLVWDVAQSKQSTFVLENFSWTFLKVVGIPEGELYDIEAVSDRAFDMRVDEGAPKVFSSARIGKAAAIVQRKKDVWISLRNKLYDRHNVTLKTQQKLFSPLAVGAVTLKIPADSNIVKTLDGSGSALVLIVSGLTADTEIFVTEGDLWPSSDFTHQASSKMVLGAHSNDQQFELESKRYNFRLLNRGNSEAAVEIRTRNKTVAGTEGPTPEPELISSPDALVMFVCVVVVFVLFSFLASYTLKNFPRSTGTLVVEEEEE